jgi:hypothetical protein
MKKLAVLCPLIAVLWLQGCATQDIKTYATPANVRIATALVCSNTLNFAVKDSDRALIANYIYSVAHGIRTLATGKVPSPDELKATVSLFSPGAGKWATLGTSISSIYGGIFAQVKGNPKLVLEYLEAIAAGCEDAASPYLVTTLPPS